MAKAVVVDSAGPRSAGMQAVRVVAVLSSFVATANILALAADTDCGACNGKWQITPYVKSVKDADDSGDIMFLTFDIGDWSHSIAGDNGAYTAEAEVKFPILTHSPARTVDKDTGPQSGEGWKRVKVTGWNKGTGTGPCGHVTAPGNAIVSVSASGTALANSAGDAGNTLAGSAGTSTVAATAELHITSTAALAFGAMQVSKLTCDAGQSLTEGGGLSSVKITVTAIPPTASTDFNFTKTGDTFAAAPTARSASVTATSAAMNVSGQQIKVYGKVLVQATSTNEAERAWAKAVTTVSQVELTIDDKGTAPGCCNDEKPNHGGHGVETLAEAEDAGT